MESKNKNKKKNGEHKEDFLRSRNKIYIYRYINKRQEITSLQTNRTIQSNKKEKRKWQTQGVPLRSRNSRFTYI